MNIKVLQQGWIADGVRFVLAGGINTFLTLLLYQALLFALSSWLSYTIAWVVGLLFVVVFYPSRVFAGARRDLRARALLGSCYAAVFLTGLGVLEVANWLGLTPRISIFLVIVMTTAANFVLGRLLLKKPQPVH